MSYNPIKLLPQELQNLISEYNVEHRPNMKLVFNELLKCVICGDINPEYTERLCVDYNIDKKRVICCSYDCQDFLYYKKRNYLKAQLFYNY